MFRISIFWRHAHWWPDHPWGPRNRRRWKESSFFLGTKGSDLEIAVNGLCFGKSLSLSAPRQCDRGRGFIDQLGALNRSGHQVLLNGIMLTVNIDHVRLAEIGLRQTRAFCEQCMPKGGTC